MKNENQKITGDLGRAPIPFAPGWNQHRWEQLFDLQRLLCEVSDINKGNCVIERLQTCIALAESLNKTDRINGYLNLVSWLKDQAIAH